MRKQRAGNVVKNTITKEDFYQEMNNTNDDDHDNWLNQRQANIEAQLSNCRFCPNQANNFAASEHHIDVNCNANDALNFKNRNTALLGMSKQAYRSNTTMKIQTMVINTAERLFIPWQTKIRLYRLWSVQKITPTPNISDSKTGRISNCGQAVFNYLTEEHHANGYKKMKTLRKQLEDKNIKLLTDKSLTLKWALQRENGILLIQSVGIDCKGTVHLGILDLERKIYYAGGLEHIEIQKEDWRKPDIEDIFKSLIGAAALLKTFIVVAKEPITDKAYKKLYKSSGKLDSKGNTKPTYRKLNNYLPV